MKLIISPRKHQFQLADPVVLTTGNFDGVHLGHQALLTRVKQLAAELNSVSAVLTFSPHPAQVLRPQEKFCRLFDSDDQNAQLALHGIAYTVVETFDAELASWPAEKFLRDYVMHHFNVKAFVVGHDFRFGAAKGGDLELLASEGLRGCFLTEVVPALRIDEQIVSSSAIRELIRNGQPQIAAKFLGRPYCINGKVVKGHQRGRQIGFPTANIEMERPDIIIPKQGVYATMVGINGKTYPAVSNLGVRPTFADQSKSSLVLETHLFDFAEDIYGREVSIYLHRFLRDEIRFANIQKLQEQIAVDVVNAKRVFK